MSQIKDNNGKERIVLWTKPLIEIIGESIFIDDQIVWRAGQFFSVDTGRIKTASIYSNIGSIEVKKKK